MRKRILVVLLAVFVCMGIFAACSGSDSSSSSDTKKSQSEIVSGIASTASKVVSDTASVASIVHQVRENVEEWTYEDWVAATEAQKEACLKFFNEKLSQNTTLDNLGKIFGTNQDKNLTEIIANQKEILSSVASNAQSAVASVQQDPGHGAAAGY